MANTASGKVPAPLNLGMNAQFFLTFINDNGEKVRFPHLAEAVIGDPTKGDLVFKVQGSEAENILKFSNRQFWITSRFEDGAETILYQGTFYSVEERDKLAANEAKINETKSAAATADEAIKNLEAKNAQLEEALQRIKLSSVTTKAPATPVKGESQPVSEGGVVIPSNVSPATAQEIQSLVPGLKPAIATEQTSIIAKFQPMAPVKTKTEVKNFKGNSTTSGRGSSSTSGRG